MQINLESPDAHSIQSYSQEQVQINNQIYRSSLMVCQQMINSDWPRHHIEAIDESDADSILQYNPEIVIIGHPHQGCFAKEPIRQLFAQKGIGLESMDIGAACRTYNVLLSEFRQVMLVLIIPDA